MSRKTPTEEEKQEAMQRIANAVRRYQTQTQTIDEKLAQYSLPTEMASHYPAIFAGQAGKTINVPTEFISSDPFMMVAIGCYRAIDVAAQLTQTNLGQITTLFILDNSLYVIDFWKLLKNIFHVSNTYEELEACIKKNRGKLIAFLRHGIFADLSPPFYKDLLPYYLSTFESEFHSLLLLINTHVMQFGFDALKSLISRVKMALCDWKNPNDQLFNFIKNLANNAGQSIRVYATDVLACIDHGEFNKESNVVQFFLNLKLLNPSHTVYREWRRMLFLGDTSLTEQVSAPHNFHVFEGIGEYTQLESIVGSQIGMRHYALKKDALLLLQERWKKALKGLQGNDSVITELQQELKTIYNQYERLIGTDAGTIEKYCLNYILSRALGVAFMKAGNVVDGIVHLKKSLAHLKGSYGHCEYVKNYDVEINNLIATHSKAEITNSNVQVTSPCR